MTDIIPLKAIYTGENVTALGEMTASDTIPGSRLNLTAPGPIGGTTPAAGSFTTLIASGGSNTPLAVYGAGIFTSIPWGRTAGVVEAKLFTSNSTDQYFTGSSSGDSGIQSVSGRLYVGTFANSDLVFMQNNNTAATLSSSGLYVNGNVRSKVANTPVSTTINKVSDFTAIGLRIDGTYTNSGDKIPIVWGTSGGISCAIHAGRVNSSTWDSEFDFYCNNVTSGPNGIDAIQKVATLSSAGLSINGIKFPATQVASADVNTLDDYEEGTWTPILGGSSGASGQTYNIQIGKYTKIGNEVIAHCYISLANKGTCSGVNTCVSGLPFSDNDYCAVSIGYWGDFTSSHTYVGGYTAGTYIVLSATNGLSANCSSAGIPLTEITNTTYLILSVTYKTSS